VASGEQWLGKNNGAKRKLWERLNPRHRKQLQLLARAMVLRQTKGPLAEPHSAQLTAALGEFERLVTRLEALLASLAALRRL
jgi:hypothetical protein